MLSLGGPPATARKSLRLTVEAPVFKCVYLRSRSGGGGADCTRFNREKMTSQCRDDEDFGVALFSQRRGMFEVCSN